MCAIWRGGCGHGEVRWSLCEDGNEVVLLLRESVLRRPSFGGGEDDFWSGYHDVIGCGRHERLYHLLDRGVSSPFSSHTDIEPYLPPNILLKPHLPSRIHILPRAGAVMGR